MKMKRKIAIILMASMVMSFSACNQQKESKPEESKATQITVSSEQAQDSENSYNVDDASKKAETDTKASQKDALSLWNESAPLKTQLTDYIKTITDQSSESYIPVENRIAVFDMDGTLCCETDPGYFDHKLLYYRVMEDPDYKDKASDEEKETAKIIEEYKHQIDKVHFPLNQMKSYKQFDSINVTDVIILKNNYLLLASCEDKYANEP